MTRQGFKKIRNLAPCDHVAWSIWFASSNTRSKSNYLARECYTAVRTCPSPSSLSSIHGELVVLIFVGYFPVLLAAPEFPLALSASISAILDSMHGVLFSVQAHSPSQVVTASYLLWFNSRPLRLQLRRLHSAGPLVTWEICLRASKFSIFFRTVLIAGSHYGIIVATINVIRNCLSVSIGLRKTSESS
jgi:hypothetical protein